MEMGINGKQLTAGDAALEGSGFSTEAAEYFETLRIEGEINMRQNTIELIGIEKIKVNATEQFDGEQVKRLAKSIKIVGLLNPIILTPDLKLVAGRLRLEAYKSLGYETIPASVITLGELEQRIAAIDENLIRKVLTKFEEAKQLSERKEIYETLFPKTRRGVAGALAKHGGATDKKSFAADTASKTGQTERNVNRIIAIFERLRPEVRDLIEHSAINNSFTEMARLYDYDVDTQIKFAELIAAKEAKTVAEANRLVDASYQSANLSGKGKFRKSVKLAKKALAQLIDDEIVKNLVEHTTEENFAFSPEDTMADLEALKKLREQVQVAIDIFEDGIRHLQIDTLVGHAAGQELALAK